MENSIYDIKNLDKHELLRKSVLVKVRTFAQADLAKQAGATGVVVLFDDEYKMANMALVLKIVKGLNLYCVAQMRKGHSLEAHILQGCRVSLFCDCIKNDTKEEDELNKQNYEPAFMSEAEGLPEALRAIEEGSLIIKNTKPTMNATELKKYYKDLNEKIREFHKFKNINSMSKYSKDHKLSMDLLSYCADKGALPVILLAEGVIKNPLDAVSIMRAGYDGLILNEEIFDTRAPLEMLKVIVQAVKYHTDDKVLLEACSALNSNKFLFFPSRLHT